MPRPRTKLPPTLAFAFALLLAGAAALTHYVHNPTATSTAEPAPTRSDSAVAPISANGAIAAHFSPHGGCTEAVVAALNAARKSIHVQAYSFTSTPIAQALADAQQRGVAVSVILDHSQRSERYSSLKFFQNQHIPVRIDAKHAIAHNKIMLIDGQTIVTGSFNFTKSAENENAENLLVITGQPTLYDAYERNFQAHLEHSEPE